MKLLVQILFLFLILNFSKSEIPTSAGTEFVVCFPTNHNCNNKDNHSLWLYIASESGDTISGDIINDFVEPKSIEFKVYGDSIAQIQMDNSLEICSCEEIEKKGIIITASKPITLYGINSKDISSDAFLCYPKNSLDTLYTIISSRNVLNGDSSGFNFDNRFSNFTIVGTEDNTLLKIIPSCPLYSPKVKQYEEMGLIINSGEVRQFIADISDTFDLTGTIISSTYPISVFSGHQRTEINVKKLGFSDVLIEMIPPISLLGSQYFITPIKSSASGFSSYSRITTFFDSTNIIIGNKSVLLNRFSFIEFYFDTALFIYSNKPLLTSVFEVMAINSMKIFNGDPFLAIPSSKEQYLNKYKFVSIPLSKFREHFINVTIHKEGIISLILDGKNVPDSLFKDVTGTDYSWAVITVTAGSHKIKSDSSFGLLVYGNGHYDSYGYNGGMKTERLLESIIDENPPQIKSSGNCNPFIKITEDKSFDTGIEIIELINEINVNTEIPPFKKGSFSVTIKAELIDKFKDGELILKANDKKGLYSYDTLEIKGMTIATSSTTIDKQVHIGHVIQDTLYINNYGKYPQTISAFCIDNIYISVPQKYFPLNIMPGETTTIPVVFGSYNLDKAMDTVVLVDECGRMVKHQIIFVSLPNDYLGYADCEVPLKFRATETESIILYNNTLIVEKMQGTIEIYNILGSLVLRRDVSGNSEISIDDLPPGLYIIRAGDKVIKFLKD